MRFAYADQLSVGLAGEHIVCADLLRLGFAPFRAEQAAAYDVAVDVGAGQLVRLQVALDIGRVAYVPPGRIIFQMPVSGSRKAKPKAWEDYSFEDLLKGLA